MIEDQHIQLNDQFVFKLLMKEMTSPSSSLRSTQEVTGSQVISPFLRELSNFSFWRSFTDTKHCPYLHIQQPSNLTKTLDSETLSRIDKTREHETAYIMMITFPKVTSDCRDSISPDVIRGSDNAFTSWHIQDLMVVKKDIEKYTLSTTEAEYIALLMSLRDVLPIIFLLDEMNYRNFQVMCTAPHIYCKALRTTRKPWNWHDCQNFVHASITCMCTTITSEITCAQEKLRCFSLEPRIKLQTI
jgi:hypothetical protein